MPRTLLYLLLCVACAQTPAGKDAGVAADRSAGEASTSLSPNGAEVEACLDRWLAAKKLDRYGEPEGTMYTGGTPLFDERTGETTPRADYVFAHHPDARSACAVAAPGR